jgi:hypothetical protein
MVGVTVGVTEGIGQSNIWVLGHPNESINLTATWVTPSNSGGRDTL